MSGHVLRSLLMILLLAAFVSAPMRTVASSPCTSLDMGMMDTGHNNQQKPCNDVNFVCAISMGCTGILGASASTVSPARLASLLLRPLTAMTEPKELVIKPHLTPPINLA